MTRLTAVALLLGLSGCAGWVAGAGAVAGILTAATGADEAVIDGYLALKGRPVGACAALGK